MFGYAVHSLGGDAAVLGELFHATRRVVIYLVSIVIWFSPIGILYTHPTANPVHSFPLFFTTSRSDLTC
jgi:Na+/H+-dicarboxylate symporter